MLIDVSRVVNISLTVYNVDQVVYVQNVKLVILLIIMVYVNYVTKQYQIVYNVQQNPTALYVKMDTNSLILMRTISCQINIVLLSI